MYGFDYLKYVWEYLKTELKVHIEGVVCFLVKIVQKSRGFRKPDVFSSESRNLSGRSRFCNLELYERSM